MRGGHILTVRGGCGRHGSRADNPREGVGAVFRASRKSRPSVVRKAASVSETGLTARPSTLQFLPSRTWSLTARDSKLISRIASEGAAEAGVDGKADSDCDFGSSTFKRKVEIDGI